MVVKAQMICFVIPESVITNQVESTREGNVFTGVCQSVHRGVVGPVPVLRRARVYPDQMTSSEGEGDDTLITGVPGGGIH